VSMRIKANSNRHLPTDKKIRTFSESCSKASDKEHPETHEKGTNEKHGSTTPFVNVDNGVN
jgi:hypothetical protein